MRFRINVNGVDSPEFDVDPATPLLWVLRDHLGLMGTKYGCGIAMCGACTVHLTDEALQINGEPVRSCQIRIDEVADKKLKVTTIEGISDAVAGLQDSANKRPELTNVIDDKTVRVAQAVQTAWRELDVVQCGYCQSGQIMTAIGLLKENQTPSNEDINNVMDAIVCRCATYHRIRKAIHVAAEKLK